MKITRVGVDLAKKGFSGTRCGCSWSAGVETAVEALQLAKRADRGGGAGM